jgi:hypothetical protein
VAGSCEYSSEPQGSKTGGEIPDQLTDYQLLKKNSSSWSKFLSR